MAEGKYGRLFTEADVRAMMIEAACAGMDGPANVRAGVIAERVLREYVGWFPADEPLFLLRGQDAYAPDAVGDYLSRVHGTSLGHREKVAEAHEGMLVWQAVHPDRVKVPD